MIAAATKTADRSRRRKQQELDIRRERERKAEQGGQEVEELALQGVPQRAPVAQEEKNQGHDKDGCCSGGMSSLLRRGLANSRVQ